MFKNHDQLPVCVSSGNKKGVTNKFPVSYKIKTIF